MFEHICDFTALAGESLLKQLEDEFQYQMNLTDGEWVFWHDTHFRGHQVEPARDAPGQAILLFFAQCACPFSTLRLGRSLSPRTAAHGPIMSDELAFRYLLQGMELIANNLYDPKVQLGMQLYLSQLEFRLACELLVGYQKELRKSQLCAEITDLLEKTISVEPSTLLQ